MEALKTRGNIIDLKDRQIVEAIMRSVKELNGVKFAEIDTDLIVLDPPYQRGEMGNADRIARAWDNRKAGAITVSLRDWKFYCIDGANRVRAAILLGQRTVNCIVYEDLMIQDEAILFATQDANKRKITTGQLTGVKCPECGEILRFEGGFNSCPSCGYSKCN